jgi:hypothetical protein
MSEGCYLPKPVVLEKTEMARFLVVFFRLRVEQNTKRSVIGCWNNG